MNEKQIQKISLREAQKAYQKAFAEWLQTEKTKSNHAVKFEEGFAIADKAFDKAYQASIAAHQKSQTPPSEAVEFADDEKSDARAFWQSF